MLENEMEINKLEEEKQLLINRIKFLEERNNELEVELKACQDVIHNNNLVAVDVVEDKMNEEDRKRLLDMLTPKKIVNNVSIKDMARGYEEMGDINLSLS